MSSVDQDTLLPFLKGKAGEFEALEQIRELEPGDRPTLIPLFDVLPEEVKFGIDNEKKWNQIETVEQALAGSAQPGG
jgi:hypothetical protein